MLDQYTWFGLTFGVKQMWTVVKSANFDSERERMLCAAFKTQCSVSAQYFDHRRRHQVANQKAMFLGETQIRLRFRTHVFGTNIRVNKVVLSSSRFSNNCHHGAIIELVSNTRI